jgi:formyl-CoA transferase
MGGLMSVTGLPGQGPVRAGIAVADSTAGLYCALGILTALLDREVTGVGRWVQTSLLQAQIAMLDFQAARWLVEGEVAGQEGNNHPTAVPMGLFQAADGHVNIAAAGDVMFTNLCRVAGADELLTDERFATGRARNANRAALFAELGRFVVRRTVAGIPCGPVYSIDAMFADPQVEHLRMARTIHDEQQGDITVVGQGFTLHDTEPTYARRAPAAGQHTEQVLLDLGYSSDEIAGFRDREVIPHA